MSGNSVRSLSPTFLSASFLLRAWALAVEFPMLIVESTEFGFVVEDIGTEPKSTGAHLRWMGE
jgi:hypothetical protein